MLEFNMIKIIRELLNIAGDYSKNLKIAFVLSFFEEIFAIIPIMLILYVLNQIISNSLTMDNIWTVGIVIVMSVILRTITRRLIDKFQANIGFKIFADERMKLGDKLKRLPMGYFSQSNIGNITAVATSDMSFIEENSMMQISKIVTAFLNTAIGVVFLTILDYRIGIISLITVLLALFALNRHEKVMEFHSGIKLQVQSKLIDAVIEYIKGIPIIKSFNMVGVRSKKLNGEFIKTRDAAIEFEKKSRFPMLIFENVFSIGIGVTILFATFFALNKSMDMIFMLMILIFIFQFYMPLKSLAGLSPQIYIMEKALERYKSISNLEIIDSGGNDIALEHFDIEFENVSFAYEEQEILHNISFKVPEHSMTALVGRSGSGKTTIANLIARFWDVDSGEIKVGNVNIKEMTADNLLKNMSMVFQNVYLFNDTVLNNIKFGDVDATKDEVIEACKKARCHEFIMELENGYDTIIGEGGSSLSGGEKQRISIARAILKDAPIIILDEATASVDPDNEKHIQKAIDELVKNKTLVMIAHKLSTIKYADQIIVIDNGRIIQEGTHNDLINEEGLYGEFWQRRIKAKSWKINKSGF